MCYFVSLISPIQYRQMGETQFDMEHFCLYKYTQNDDYVTKIACCDGGSADCEEELTDTVREDFDI